MLALACSPKKGLAVTPNPSLASPICGISCSCMSVLRKIRKSIARFLICQLADRPPIASPLSGRLHIVVPRWDAKLGDSIVSSFFFREARKLNAQVTVLTVAELATLHAQDFGVDRVIVTGANPRAARHCELVADLAPTKTLQEIPSCRPP